MTSHFPAFRLCEWMLKASIESCHSIQAETPKWIRFAPEMMMEMPISVPMVSIVRGAILEKFIPDAETLSDDDVSALLSGLLNKPDNQRWMKTWLEAHRAEEPIESVVVAGTFDEDEDPGWSEVPLDGTS